MMQPLQIMHNKLVLPASKKSKFFLAQRLEAE
jgi:hypothetical protein